VSILRAPYREANESLGKFTYHTIGIQRQLDKVLGAERLSIYGKVTAMKQMSTAEGLITKQIKTRFNGHHLAQVGRMITEVVSARQKAFHDNFALTASRSTLKKPYSSTERLSKSVSTTS